MENYLTVSNLVNLTSSQYKQRNLIRKQYPFHVGVYYTSKRLKRTYHDECARNFDHERTPTFKKEINDPASFSFKKEQFETFYKLVVKKIDVKVFLNGFYSYTLRDTQRKSMCILQNVLYIQVHSIYVPQTSMRNICTFILNY